MNIEQCYQKFTDIDPELPHLMNVLLERCKRQVCECKQDMKTVEQFFEHIAASEDKSVAALKESLNTLLHNPNIQLAKQGCMVEKIQVIEESIPIKHA